MKDHKRFSFRIETVPTILNKMKSSTSSEEVQTYENKFACMIASPAMFMASILNFFILNVLLKYNTFEIALNSSMFFLFFILAELHLRLNLPTKFVSLFVSFLYPAVSLFVFFRLYKYIGPAIWTLFCIQLAFAIFRQKKDMAITLAIATVFCIFYTLFNLDAFAYELTTTYFNTQFLLILLLFFVSFSLQKINSDRIHILRKKIVESEEKTSEITALYEEIAATEEELRNQNEKLQDREKELYEIAFFDSLTGLPNREMFMDFLEETIDYSRKNNRSFYLLSIDIDDFKKINDTMGHHIGDFFIEFASKRLKESVNEKDFLCRSGGDEFFVIITRDVEKKQLNKELQLLQKQFLLPFKVNTSEFKMTASFGVALYPGDSQDIAGLIQCADMAMNSTKESGKNSVKFFNKKMKELLVEQTSIENLMSDALKFNEFYLVYQPQYSLSDSNVRGFEVLCRWKSSSLGEIPPLKFIPIAEHNGFIYHLGEWILRTACSSYMKNKAFSAQNLILSVNISSLQLRSANFISSIKEIIDETGINPAYLEFEITESVCIDSFENAFQTLVQLKELGIKIALDDFGTGYSSLSYLKVLPIDTLKIDKFFIDEILVQDHVPKIIGDIISLGHNLGHEIIAEGVEITDQKQYLEDKKCDYIQGYLMSRPISIDDLEALITS